MFTIIKAAIEAGNYKLAEVREKIQRMYMRGFITDAQMVELLDMASGRVNAEAERPDVLEILKGLAARIDAIEKHFEEAGDNTGNPAEYEDWKPWDGISNKYQYGEIVRHDGKLWISVYHGQNVWQPGAEGIETLWHIYKEE